MSLGKAWIGSRSLGDGTGKGPFTGITGLTISSDSTITVTGAFFIATAGPITITSGSTITWSGFATGGPATNLINGSACDNKIDSQQVIVVPAGFGIAPIKYPVIAPPVLAPIPQFNIPFVDAAGVGVNSNSSAFDPTFILNQMGTDRFNNWGGAWDNQRYGINREVIFSLPGVIAVTSSPSYKMRVEWRNGLYITQIDATLITAPSGGSAVAVVKQNGATVATLTFASGQISVSQQVNVLCLDGDLIVAAVTSTTAPAADLCIMCRWGYVPVNS